MGQRLGQHFLKDNDMLGSIIEFSGISSSSDILEVGPGQGDLTTRLSNAANSVVAVEFDHNLAVSLMTQFTKSNVEIVEADILNFDFNKLPKNYCVVANIPYYLTSKLIRQLLESKNKPSSIVLLIQKEVAERLAAKPGSMSLLSVSAQLYSSVTLGPVVGPEYFTPPPKVNSQVVKLNIEDNPIIDSIDIKRFFRLVKAGFSEKRKKLTNSLAGSLALDSSFIKDILKEAGLKDTARAQELSMEAWLEIYKIFVKHKLI